MYIFLWSHRPSEGICPHPSTCFSLNPPTYLFYEAALTSSSLPREKMGSESRSRFSKVAQQGAGNLGLKTALSVESTGVSLVFFSAAQTTIQRSSGHESGSLLCLLPNLEGWQKMERELGTLYEIAWTLVFFLNFRSYYVLTNESPLATRKTSNSLTWTQPSFYIHFHLFSFLLLLTLPPMQSPAANIPKLTHCPEHVPFPNFFAQTVLFFPLAWCDLPCTIENPSQVSKVSLLCAAFSDSPGKFSHLSSLCCLAAYHRDCRHKLWSQDAWDWECSLGKDA